LGDESSRSALPKTLFSTRHGFETLLRRLIIGSKQYPNIEQIVGTVTGVIPSVSDPTRLQAVSVRTNEGDQILDAALVIGSWINISTYPVMLICVKLLQIALVLRKQA
jgi:hypothetical protein